MPSAVLSRSRFEAGYPVVDLFTDAGLVSSKSEARRLVQQGGAFVAAAAVTDLSALIGVDALDGAGSLILRAGKKRYCRVSVTWAAEVSLGFPLSTS
jgi:tyrosyl-tRNA synthetase